MNIAIIDYNAGNTQSVRYALERLGTSAIITNKKEEILAAEKIIFPGVGQAKSAMTELRKSGLDLLIPNLKQDVLGICLGMQLLCTYTEEGDIDGLGIFPNKIKKIPAGNIVPHTGWNQIYGNSTELLKGIKEMEHMYFVHSYFADVSDCTISKSNYHAPFSAALQKDNFYACQFHPEKSGDRGQRIIENFLNLKK